MIHLRASALPRVLACLGSVGIVAALAAAETPETDAAREGSAAHWVAEQMLRGMEMSKLVEPGMVAGNGVPVDAEMIEHARAYADHCIGQPSSEAWVEVACGFQLTPDIAIGCKVDAAWYDPATRTLHVRDYKYGWRLVDPDGNWQLISYAIGIIRKLFADRPPLHVCVGIYQPRPYHPDGPLRTATLTLTELVEAHDELVVRLALPSDALATGDHCDHCPAGIMDACPAYRVATGNAIDVAMRGGSADPSLPGVGRELVMITRARQVLEQREEWLKDIAKRAIKAEPGAVPGWSLEPQYANTTWTLDAAALTQLTNVDVLVAPKLVTPAEAKRRGVSEEVITANTKRPVIGEKLVRRDPDAFVRKKLGKPKTAKPR